MSDSKLRRQVEKEYREKKETVQLYLKFRAIMAKSAKSAK